MLTNEVTLIEMHKFAAQKVPSLSSGSSSPNPTVTASLVIENSFENTVPTKLTLTVVRGLASDAPVPFFIAIICRVCYWWLILLNVFSCVYITMYLLCMYTNTA